MNPWEMKLNCLAYWLSWINQDHSEGTQYDMAIVKKA